MSANEEHDDSSLVRSVLDQLKERFEILSRGESRSPSRIEREATKLSGQAARVVHPLVATGQAFVGLLPEDFTDEPVDTLEGVGIEFYDKWWVAVVAGLANEAATTGVSPNRSIRQTLDNCFRQYQDWPSTHWALPSSRKDTAFWPLFCETSCSAIDSCLSSLRPDFVLDPDTQKAMIVMQACLSGPVTDPAPQIGLRSGTSDFKDVTDPPADWLRRQKKDKGKGLKISAVTCLRAMRTPRTAVKLDGDYSGLRLLISNEMPEKFRKCFETNRKPPRLTYHPDGFNSR